MAGTTGSPVSAAIHAVMKAMRDSHHDHRAATAAAYPGHGAPPVSAESRTAASSGAGGAP